MKGTYQDLREEEESMSNFESEFENDSMPSKNPNMPSTEKLSCITLEQQQRVQELLDDLRKGHRPRDYSEEMATDASLNAVNYQDFPALRRACAKLTMKSKDKKLDIVFRACITAMVGTLNLYLDPELSYTW